MVLRPVPAPEVARTSLPHSLVFCLRKGETGRNNARGWFCFVLSEGTRVLTAPSYREFRGEYRREVTSGLGGQSQAVASPPHPDVPAGISLPMSDAVRRIWCEGTPVSLPRKWNPERKPAGDVWRSTSELPAGVSRPGRSRTGDIPIMSRSNSCLTALENESEENTARSVHAP